MYLLDTDVLWALRNAKAGKADGRLLSWAEEVAPETLFISVVSLMELEGGVGRLARREKALGASVRNWIDERLRPAFEDRTLPIDSAVATRWARLNYADHRDGLLAATALEHKTILVTRHGSAFKQGRVRTLNPWTYTAPSPDIRWGDESLTGSLWLKSFFR